MSEVMLGPRSLKYFPRARGLRLSSASVSVGVGVLGETEPLVEEGVLVRQELLPALAGGLAGCLQGDEGHRVPVEPLLEAREVLGVLLDRGHRLPRLLLGNGVGQEWRLHALP